jgi:hypothetical protein
MKMNRASRLGLSLFSVGWVLPLGLAADMYASYITQEFLPLMRGGYPLRSFPHLSAATSLIEFGLAWLGVVLAG